MFSVPAPTSIKGFDEDSVASLITALDETQDTHVAENGITNNSSHPFQGGGYMLAASYWPKVNHCTVHVQPSHCYSYIMTLHTVAYTVSEV